MEDARKALADVLRQQIAPRLRALGFVGSGRTFRLPNPEAHFALLGFQRCRYSDPELARVTANVSFYRAEEWREARTRQPSLPATPGANTVYSVGWHERVGYLLPFPHDHWWPVTSAHEDAALVASDVLAVVEAYVLPQLLARIEKQVPPTPVEPVVFTTSHCPWPYCEDTAL